MFSHSGQWEESDVTDYGIGVQGCGGSDNTRGITFCCISTEITQHAGRLSGGPQVPTPDRGNSCITAHTLYYPTTATHMTRREAPRELENQERTLFGGGGKEREIIGSQ